VQIIIPVPLASHHCKKETESRCIVQPYSTIRQLLLYIRKTHGSFPNFLHSLSYFRLSPLPLCPLDPTFPTHDGGAITEGSNFFMGECSTVCLLTSFLGLTTIMSSSSISSISTDTAKEGTYSKTSNPSIPQVPISPSPSGSNLCRNTNNPAEGEQHGSAPFDSPEQDLTFGHSLATAARVRLKARRADSILLDVT
jgi:hypothetical protein